jgi:hypothetical protein
MYWGETNSLSLNVSNMTARSRSICANSQRRERKRWRFSGARDEWTVYKNLDMIIKYVTRCWLVEWVVVFPKGIPSHWKTRHKNLSICTYEWRFWQAYNDLALNLPICSTPSLVLKRYAAPNSVLHNQIKFSTCWWHTERYVSVTRSWRGGRTYNCSKAIW